MDLLLDPQVFLNAYTTTQPHNHICSLVDAVCGYTMVECGARWMWSEVDAMDGWMDGRVEVEVEVEVESGPSGYLHT